MTVGNSQAIPFMHLMIFMSMNWIISTLMSPCMRTRSLPLSVKANLCFRIFKFFLYRAEMINI